ncbi:flagellar basal body protein FliL [Hydrocarboniclastica marina]|uniref:Flagellar protein FliL n=2 Tax=Hydrocarboniclastica marina TaxID=2259620 RepID=A0A4P7XFD5_9ALTE|nr:flagellar basal body protein FliL [Hydrocarboniclastica marina]
MRRISDMAEKKSLKTILIAAVLVIVAVAISVGATMFVLSGSNDEAEGEEAQAETVVPEPLQYFSFPKAFVTTVASENRARHLQVFVALAYRDSAVEAALNTHAPLLRSRLLALFGRGDYMALQSADGREALKAEALQVLNDTLAAEGAAPVERVLFTNFVLQ